MPIQSGTVAMGGVNDAEWRLDEGSGVRTADTTVVFVPAFDQVPKVVVSISMFNAGTAVGGPTQPTQIAVTVEAKNIRKELFEVVFGTKGNSRILEARASWVAHTD